MATIHRPAGHSPEGGSKAPPKKQPNAQKRKRTKSGCITCRKRRIKCDENHPVCSNCIRSRRQCEGYKNPLVFRSEPASHYGPHTVIGPPYPHYQYSAPIGPATFQSPLYNQISGPPVSIDVLPSTSGPHTYPGAVPFTNPTGHGALVNDPYQHPILSPHAEAAGSSSFDRFQGVFPQHELPGNGTYMTFHNDFQTRHTIGEVSDGFESGALPGVTHPEHDAFGYEHGDVFPPERLDDAPTTMLERGQTLHPPQHTLAGFQQPLPSSARPLANDFAHHDSYQSSHSSIIEDARPAIAYGGGHHYDITESPPRIPDMSSSSSGYLSASDQHIVTFTGPHHSISLDLDPYFRRADEILLNDPYTKDIFQHFMRSTGAMLTAFDRSSTFDMPILDRNSRPLAYPGLWTHTMPMLALKNLGLLHGMLALASLQIAHQSGQSTTPSWKHYTHAWRKVHSVVRNDPGQRGDVGTFAATMLLAYYEVATADHSRWNMHLSAVGQLIREMDFAGMTRRLRAMEQERQEITMHSNYGYIRDSSSIPSFMTAVLDRFSDIDVDFVSQMTGEPIQLDDSGYLWRNMRRRENRRPFSMSELGDYTTYQDLFWWYTRHDVIHALVGGADLLLEYELWTECPPRAPIGHGNAHYGSFDHLMLLMGRLIQWAMKDRIRKRKMFDMNVSKAPSPAKCKNASRENSRKPGSATTSSRDSKSPIPKPSRPTSAPRAQAPPRAPPFYGMTPSKGRPPMPAAFRTDEPSPLSAEVEEEELDLEHATLDAFKGWNSIRAAFDTFYKALGPDFEPLPDEEYSFDTPFGRALVYRSHGIACLMAWYYTGLIVAHRAQPNMPPFATMAVGAARHDTLNMANTIGRVLAGIRPPLNQLPLRPSDAGALGDCAIPMLFAAVQYDKADQRKWTIDWFKSIEQMTGFASIAVCANGCEGAWARMGEQGRGPRYERTLGISVVQNAGDTTGNHVPATAKAHEAAHGGSDGAAGTNGKDKFVALQRGGHVMRAYQLYTAPLEAMGRLSLGSD